MSIDQNAPPPAGLDAGADVFDPDTLVDEEEETPVRDWSQVNDWVNRAIDWVWDNWPTILVAAGILWYGWYFSKLTTEIHQGYGTSAFDIGVFDQGVWLLSRFHNPFITITGRNLFADHTSFILIAVAPIYWIFPGASTLLVLQAFALAAAAWPIYLLGRKRLGAPMGALIALAYLLQPALSSSNMENFHPDCFMALFVAMFLYAAIEDKRWLFVISAVLCCLVKEDAVLLVLPIALWYAWRRNIRLGAIVAGASVVWALICFRIIRTFNHGVDLQTSARVPFGGHYSDVVREFLRRPGDVVDYVRTDQRPWYVWQMLAPVGFVFLISPEVALVGFFVLAWNVLSTFGYQHGIGYHYQMVLVPAIVIGTLWAISRLKTLTRRRIATGFVFLCALWTGFLWGPFSWSRYGPPGHWTSKNPVVQQINQINKQLPPNAVVSAYHSIVPHIDHRTRIYMWPVPFHAVYWAQFKQEGQTLPFANEIQYLELPTQLPAEDQKTFDTISSQFEQVASNPTATLWKRKGT